jgi:hypothetical protein
MGTIEQAGGQLDLDSPEAESNRGKVEDNIALRDSGITQRALDLVRNNSYGATIPEAITALDMFSSVYIQGSYYIDGADGARVSERVWLNFDFAEAVAGKSGMRLEWDREDGSISAVDGGIHMYGAQLSAGQNQVIGSIVERKKAVLPFTPQIMESTVVIEAPIEIL